MICNIHKFRAKLKAGHLCLGAGISFTDPAVTEALCDSVDFFWLDLEHTPISLESLQAHLIAARAGGTPALVRVPSGEIGWVKRVLDIGAEGIILPQARTVGEVEAFVAACRYPPQGRRGFGPRRPSNYGRLSGPEFLKSTNDGLFVSVQIETAEAFRALDAILQVPGIDSVVIGPADLAGSLLGRAGEVSHPQVLDAIATISSKARQAGLYVGIGMGPDEAFAVEAARRGVHWIQCGGDYSYMVRGADGLFQRIRSNAHEVDGAVTPAPVSVRGKVPVEKPAGR